MPHPVELIGGATTAVITGSTVVELADHDVGVLSTLTVAFAMLSAGVTLTERVAQAVTTEVYRCSVQTCSVEIRATRNHAPERLAVLREMATDHSRHGTAVL
ncbi:hypothetical protein [Streptomyces sp. CC224B]|uniref:hypothetical protein n=1 Tax=Streptomyces sp. CC224B TaxID=3044571 RepID=UPI0024A8F03A|nr:hypothetical protein [Streptomyces sp. CC224B]